MKNKLLILAIYPAPYRTEPIRRISKEFNTDVFFEADNGHERNSQYFDDKEWNYLRSKAERNKLVKCWIKIKSYDLVVLYDYLTRHSIITIVACILFHVPYIINSDGKMLASHGNRINDIIKKYIFRHASGFLASGKYAREYFLEYGADNSNIYTHKFTSLESEDLIGQKLSMTEKNRLRKTLGLDKWNKIAVAVGRFIPLKRYDYLIKAWCNMMPEDYLLILIGGGNEEDQYRRIVSEFNSFNVRIEQYHPKNELTQYYQCADIFVHPTSYDVWGLVVNEALANGLPVVVSDHCIAGLELISNGKNGYIVKMGDEAELCQRAKEILQDDDHRIEMSREAFNSIKGYTMDSMAKSQINAIKAVIANVKCNY